MVLSIAAPTAANNAAAGVDIITGESPYGQTLTYNKIDAAKTAVVGTHEFTITASDWWGTANTKTNTQTLLISDAACENKDTLTLTYTGTDAASYALGSDSVDYPYGVSALLPNYCKYTIASTLLPTTNSINSHLTNDATNNKYVMAKVEGPGSLAAAYEV